MRRDELPGEGEAEIKGGKMVKVKERKKVLLELGAERESGFVLCEGREVTRLRERIVSPKVLKEGQEEKEGPKEKVKEGREGDGRRAVRDGVPLQGIYLHSNEKGEERNKVDEERGQGRTKRAEGLG